jgi:hypothetical protein
MTTLQEEYNNNKIIIENYLKRQEDLKIVLDREKKINLMTDDKFDILQEQLNKILELQKEYNIIVSDRKLPITQKYLPFPYDVNDIIRKKIITDSQYKLEEDYIKAVAEWREINLLEDMCDDIRCIIHRYTHKPTYMPIDNVLEEYENIITIKYNEFSNKTSYNWCIENNCLFGTGVGKEFMYKKQHQKLVKQLYNNMRAKVLILTFKKITDIMETDIDTDIITDDMGYIKSFSGYNMLNSKNNINPQGYKKFCKKVLEIIGKYYTLENNITMSNTYWGLVDDNILNYKRKNLYSKLKQKYNYI